MTQSAPGTIAELGEEWARLKGVEKEYQVTVRVLAVLAERLLALTGGDVVTVTDRALAESPDLNAWRDTAITGVAIAVSR